MELVYYLEETCLSSVSDGTRVYTLLTRNSILLPSLRSIRLVGVVWSTRYPTVCRIGLVKVSVGVTEEI